MKMVNVLLSVYNLVWNVAIVLSLPLVLFGDKQRYAGRLGIRRPSIRTGSRRIWVHALSVGEVISAIPVIKAIKKQYPSNELVFTVKTLQGMKIARSELKGEVDFLLPMPLDFWWTVRQFIRQVDPLIFILVETDIWPGLVSSLKKRGVKTILVNGRISPKTYKTYKHFSFIVSRILGLFDKCLMQSDLDRDRLLNVGMPGDAVETVGNIKYDRSWTPVDEKEREYWFSELKTGPSDRIWVAGSTHEGEDEIILDTYRKLRKEYPRLRLLIAPRRIERSEQVMDIGLKMGLDVSMRTSIKEGCQVLVLDTLGELGRIYGLAEISFVGGSLVPVGGHNLLEPASFGCPVIFGPHTQNFVDMAETLEKAGGGIRVEKDDIFGAMDGLLGDGERLRLTGINARDFVERNRGALDRVMKHIGRYI